MLKTSSSDSLFPDQMWQFAEAYEQEVLRDRFASEKCPIATRKLRSHAALFCARKHFVNAIETLNQALCFAPVDSPVVGVLLANRGNAFYHMGLYAECAHSLKLALRHGYPEEMRARLRRKIRACQEKSAAACTEQPPQFALRLSYAANARVPAVIEGLHVEENREFGRHLVADVDLQVGDVVCIEAPYVLVVARGQGFRRCHFCCEEAPHRLLPCPGCTHAMFCSDACRELAWAQFHQWECRLADELWALPLDTGRLALRALLLALTQFGGDVAQLQRFVEEQAPRPGQHALNPWDLDWRRPCAKQQFLAYCNGYASDAHFSAEMRAAVDQCAVRLTCLLAEYTAYSAQLRCERARFRLSRLLRHLLLVNANNCYDVANSSQEEARSSNCLGVFLCMSMASHACAGNVMRLRLDSTRQLWLVVRPIRAGAQVLDNYGSFFQYQGWAERQERCLQHYGFRCRCDACADDYPTTDELQEAPGVPYPPESRISDGAPLAMEEARLELEALREYLGEYSDHYPSLQLAVAETALTSLFRSLTDDRLLEHRFPQFFSRAPLPDMHHQQAA